MMLGRYKVKLACDGCGKTVGKDWVEIWTSHYDVRFYLCSIACSLDLLQNGKLGAPTEPVAKIDVDKSPEL